MLSKLLSTFATLFNKCAVSKIDEINRDGFELPIVEEFYTIQGEGFHTGKPAYFIRIGGCDVCCSWCDVKVSWNPLIHPIGKVEDIVANALAYPARAVVVTGGEPMLYNMEYLCNTLQKNGIQRFLETSGSQPISGNWDWICMSPKKQSTPLESNFSKINEIKIVIDKNLDFAWAEENRKVCTPDCKLYLQPEWSAFKTIISAVVDYVKAHPYWNISLQTHHFMHIP